jgi:hypothetical protein
VKTAQRTFVYQRPVGRPKEGALPSLGHESCSNQVPQRTSILASAGQPNTYMVAPPPHSLRLADAAINTTHEQHHDGGILWQRCRSSCPLVIGS